MKQQQDKKTGRFLPKLTDKQYNQIKQWVLQEKPWEEIRAHIILDFGLTERWAYVLYEKVNKELGEEK